jgi:hypothetical protein
MAIDCRELKASVAQARVLRNDALILDATLDATAQDGLPGIALTAVSRRRRGLLALRLGDWRPSSQARASV